MPPTPIDVAAFLYARTYPDECNISISVQPGGDFVLVTASYCCLTATSVFEVLSDSAGPWRDKLGARVDAAIDRLIDRHAELHGGASSGANPPSDPLDAAYDRFDAAVKRIGGGS